MSASRKTLTIASVAALFAGAGAIAYAASMAVTTTKLGAGQTTIAACAGGTVAASYPAPTDSGTGFRVANLTVTLTNADATACNGNKIYVNLTDGTNIVAAGPVAGTAVSTGTTTYSPALTWTAGKTIADVTQIDVAIT